MERPFILGTVVNTTFELHSAKKYQLGESRLFFTKVENIKMIIGVI